MNFDGGHFDQSSDDFDDDAPNPALIEGGPAAYQSVRSLRALLSAARTHLAAGDDPAELLGDDDATWRDVFYEDGQELDEHLSVIDSYVSEAEDPLCDGWGTTLQCESDLYALECGFSDDDDEFTPPDELIEHLVIAWCITEAALECDPSAYVTEADRPLVLVDYLRKVTLSYAVASTVEVCNQLFEEIVSHVRPESLLRGLALLDAASASRQFANEAHTQADQRLFITRANRLQRSACSALEHAAHDTDIDRMASASFAAFTLICNLANNRVDEAGRLLTHGYQVLCALPNPEYQLQIAHRDAELHLGHLAPPVGVDALIHDPATGEPRLDRIQALLDAGMQRLEGGRLFGAVPPLQEAFRTAKLEHNDEMMLAVAEPLLYTLAETTERACADHLLRESTAHASIQRDLQSRAAGLHTAHAIALDCVQAALRVARPGFALHALIDAAYTRERFHDLAGSHQFPTEQLESAALALRDAGWTEWAALCGTQIADLLNQRGEGELARAHAGQALSAFHDSGLGARVTLAAGDWMQEHWGTQSVAALQDTIEQWRERLHGTDWSVDGTLFEHLFIAATSAAVAERCKAQFKLARTNSCDIVGNENLDPAQHQDLAGLRGQALLLRAETLATVGFASTMAHTFEKAQRAFQEAGDLIGELECEMIARRALGDDIDPPGFGIEREL